jgi:hypothetical protein
MKCKGNGDNQINVEQHTYTYRKQYSREVRIAVELEGTNYGKMCDNGGNEKGRNCERKRKKRICTVKHMLIWISPGRRREGMWISD